MSFNCCDKDGLNKAIPCELSHSDMLMANIAAELEYTEKIKAKTECSMNKTKLEPKRYLEVNLTIAVFKKSLVLLHSFVFP